MLTMDDARQRVAKGAAHLDTVRPGWFNRIDVGTLTLHDPCGCIVGQLVPTTNRENFSVNGRALFSIMTSNFCDLAPFGVDIDFLSGERRNAFDTLQDCWIEAIADRRLRETTSVDDHTDDKRGTTDSAQPVLSLRA